MTDTHIQEAAAQPQLQQPATTKSVASETEIVPGDATTTPKPEAEPALEPDHNDEPVLETEEVIYVTSTLGSDPTLASTAVAPEPADTSAEPKQSRLSMAFKRISCGLCFHPLKNNGATDYHALVVTPTEEEAPILGQEYDYHHRSDIEGGSGPVVITDDFKGEHYFSTEGASSSVGHHHEGSALHKESKALQHGQQEVTSAVFEETIIIDGPTAEESSRPSDSRATAQELVSERSLPETATAAASEVIEKQPTPAVTIPTTSATVVLDTPLASPSGTPSTTRSKAFAKLKRRSTTSSPAASSIPSSPTSTSNNSPLLERLGRFAKLMRSNETSSSTTTTTSTSNSSIQTKVVESLQVGQAPEKQATVTSVTSIPVATSTADVKDTAANTQVDQKETIATPAADCPTESDPLSPVPPLPRHARRSSLALDTQVFKSQPVAIPGQLQEVSTPMSAPLSATLVQNHIWTQSESPTLHQHDASTSSGRSLTLLTRTGRASTMDSAKTIEGNSSEAGSLGSSGKDGSFLKDGKDSKDDKKQRRKSVLKKLGKMINGDRKKEKAEKRLSQQGSMTMQSPIEAEENFGF
ncbi:unnamed protein product [Mortierella alpina]